MKKILTILGALSLTASMAATVIACGENEKGLADNDLRKIVTITDLGEIKDADVVRGQYDVQAFKIAQEKNPNLTTEILGHIIAKELNSYIVDGKNVSMTLIPAEGYKDVVGEVTISFTMEAGSMPSLLDIKNLKNTHLGEITLQEGNTNPTNDQILELFFVKNPGYENDKAAFTADTMHIMEIPGSKDKRFLVPIVFDSSKSSNYDIRLASEINVSFTIK